HSVEAIASFDKTLATLKHDIEADEKRRKAIIEKLKEIRTSLLKIKNEQCENIVLNGEGISPINAADYVRKNKEKLGGIIPGKVFDLETLPVSHSELAELYSSNGTLTSSEEDELACALPNKADIMPEDEFRSLVERYNDNLTVLGDIKKRKHWEFSVLNQFEFSLKNLKNDFVVKTTSLKVIADIRETIKSIPDFQNWEIKVVSDGINQDVHKASWQRLVDDVTATYKIYENYEKETFGKVVAISDVARALSHKKEYMELKGSGGKISLMGKLFGSAGKKEALELVSINGQKISCSEDCSLVLSYLNLLEKRNACCVAWDRLMKGLGVKGFEELSVDCPEEVALRYCNKISSLLLWHEQKLLPIVTQLKTIGMPFDSLAGTNELNSDQENFISTLKFVKEELGLVLDGIIEVDKKRKTTVVLDDYHKKLTAGSLVRSEACIALADAVNSRDIDVYLKSRRELVELIDKYRVQFRRNELLEKIRKYAPEWAEQIKNRVGIHGLAEVPNYIGEAWKWKQLNNIIDKLNNSDYDSLQKEANRLSNQYREETAKLAADKAWYHLVKRNEKSTDLQQALKGWAYDMKKIGKGTGKLAKHYKDAARKKMVICQKAVPAWIMPIRKAIETLDPALNRFDVVIVDEASQSDLTALAIAFLGNKVIVVGDDKQVSPLAVGVQSDKVKKDADMYIKGIIPNSELYTPTDSLYTIADTTFQSMMLLEHFRCVPEIIGFSNMLSYDYKIKPLREASSSKLLPA
ncbi:MAG: AAA domain-containing protein, partial [Bacteroidia bacterium]|nr:AAA domain-containing protein [Bacteroidia bacterium]